MGIAVDSKNWGPEYTQGVAPSNPKHGTSWFDTSANKLKVYDLPNTSWTWIRIPEAGFGLVAGGYNLSTNVDKIIFPFDSGTTSVVGTLDAMELLIHLPLIG